MMYSSSHLLFLYPFIFQNHSVKPRKEMGLLRINTTAGDLPWLCPRTKWHLPGFFASTQYGERSKGATIVQFEGSLLSGCDRTLTRKRRGTKQWGLGRSYGGSRLQGGV